MEEGSHGFALGRGPLKRGVEPLNELDPGLDPPLTMTLRIVDGL